MGGVKEVIYAPPGACNCLRGARSARDRGSGPARHHQSRRHEHPCFAWRARLPRQGRTGGQEHDQDSLHTPHQRLRGSCTPKLVLRAFAWVGRQPQPPGSPTPQNHLSGVQAARQRRSSPSAGRIKPPPLGTRPTSRAQAPGPAPSGSSRCSAAAQPCPSGREKSTGWRRRWPSCPGWTHSRACPVQWQQRA